MIVANWKMNGSKASIDGWINTVSKSIKPNPEVPCVFCPPSLYIDFSRKLIDSILEIIVEDLNKNNKVKISGFGTFKIINKKSREGRNPKSKELFLIKPRKVVSFYPSKEVRKKINEKP